MGLRTPHHETCKEQHTVSSGSEMTGEEINPDHPEMHHRTNSEHAAAEPALLPNFSAIFAFKQI